MKKVLLSIFLYISLCLVFIFPKVLVAQKITDSIAYYHNAIYTTANDTITAEAISFFERQIKNDKTTKNTFRTISYKENIANGLFNLGKRFESEKTGVEALKLVEELPVNEESNILRKRLSNLLGRLFKKYDDFDNALKYFRKSLTLNKDKKDSITIINNIGSIYLAQKNYKEAYTVLAPIYTSLSPLDSVYKITSLDNIGFIQHKLNMPEALPNMKKALEANSLYGNKASTFSIYRHLTYYYLENKNEEEARYYIEKLNEMASLFTDLTFQLEIISLNILFNKNTDALLYKKISDSLKNITQDIENTYFAAKNDVVETQRKAKENELIALKSKNEKIVSYIITGIAICLAIGIILFLARKHKKEKTKEIIQETYQTERRISKKVHDELANDMSDTINLIDNNIEIPFEIKKQLLDKLDNLYDRTRDISADISGFDSTKFGKSLKFLLTQHNAHGVKVITNVATGIDWNKVANHKKINIYRSLQELLVNMKKHSEATEVAVIFKTDGLNYSINYTDNGKGTTLLNVPFRGLHNVETRMKNIGGSATFISSKGNGFKTNLHF